MIGQLRKRFVASRRAFVIGLFAFAITQTIGLAHAAELKLHAHHAACHICLAMGHAAAPPPPAALPTLPPPFEFAVALPCFIAAILRPTFSLHAPRGPPTPV